MLAEERLNQILNWVNEKKSISVLELTELLNISESTIRRDLTTLHQRKQLIKVHGGATSIGLQYKTTDDDVENRLDMNIDDKRAIGKYGASLIEKGDFVFIDAGTTTDCLIDYVDQEDVIFVTNAVFHGRKLVKKGYKVILLGGELKKSTEAVVGVETIESLKKYNFTKGFFGANGIDIEHGLTTPDYNEALVKQTAFRQCREAYVLCDVAKIGQISSVSFAGFEDGMILTTNLEEKSWQAYEHIKEVEN